MKKLLAGLFTTIVGGLVVLAVQLYVQGMRSDSKQFEKIEINTISVPSLSTMPASPRQVVSSPSSSMSPSVANSVRNSAHILSVPEYPEASLSILGSNSDVEIRRAKRGLPYKGGAILSSNTDQVVFLPLGQRLTVQLMGSNSNLSIEESIAEQVTVNNLAAGADVKFL